MKKIKIYFLFASDENIEKIMSLSYLKEQDFEVVNRYKNIEAKKEKIVSIYFKNKYIKDYHLNENGKPISNDVYFNVSHSHGLVCFVMDEKEPIGIDIEKIKEVDEKLKRYIANDDEFEYMKNEINFYEVWTAKEALVKAYGSGLKMKVNEIPALPINGLRYFKNKKYMNQSIIYNEYVLSVSKKGTSNYCLEMVEEIVK